MAQSEFIKRIEDLADRCERQSTLTSTGFLTPAEQYELSQWASHRPDVRILLHGGGTDCERQCAFFLPFWLEPADFRPEEYIRAVRIDASFAQPEHRDYMGACLALGIQRPWLGDFRIVGPSAWVFCLPTVEPLLLDELSAVGRAGVKTSACPLRDVPNPERNVRRVRFTAKSLRLDAVAGPMFGLSRTGAAELIRLGAATLNYAPCDKADAQVKEGDVISLRGRGKGILSAVGGRSRKDRLFVEADIYL